MDSRIQKNIGKVVLSLIALFCVVGGTGCDDSLMGGYLDALTGGYTSGLTAGYPTTGFPATGYYDPTNDIQSVNSYRQDVMDWSNDQWDAYIRE
jgi:hypothetical protein